MLVPIDANENTLVETNHILSIHFRPASDFNKGTVWAKVYYLHRDTPLEYDTGFNEPGEASYEFDRRRGVFDES